MKTFKLSQLIIDNEDPYYRDDKRLKNDKEKKIREVYDGDRIRHLTWIDNAKDIKSIKSPDGHELTPEELFDFIIGNNITDLAKTKNTGEPIADIAIVLGAGCFPVARERAIKGCELYKLGLVKKIIFTGGINKERNKGFMKYDSLEGYMNNEEVNGLDWRNLPEGDWGAETLIKDVFDEDYQKHVAKLTTEFLNSVGINTEDILTETMSTTTEENAEFCKNIFDMEEIETGMQVKTAVIVTTCTHGGRAMRQFQKVFGDKINLQWCPSTIDLEQYEGLKNILENPNFDEIAFRNELKRLYCTDPKLTQMLREEVGHNRNVFIRGEIDEPLITVNNKEITDISDDARE